MFATIIWALQCCWSQVKCCQKLNYSGKNQKEVCGHKFTTEQYSFQSGLPCVELINTFRITVEQTTEYRTPLYLMFNDSEKVFDSINRSPYGRP